MRERTWMLEQRIASLERERKDLLRILRGLGEGVVAVDRAGIVVHANPAAISMLSLDKSICLGQHMYVAVPHPALCDLLEDVMRGEGKVVRELVLERPEGDNVFQVAVRSLRKAGVEDGEPEGAIAVVRDVTELRRLERARQDFFGNVSHELKTPVTAIRGAIETIVDDPEMPEETRSKFLDSARRHAMRLGTLVTDLIALARLEGDPRNLQRSDVDLTGLVDEVIRAAESQAAKRSISIDLDVSADADAGKVLVFGDEEAMRQAISNLVDNAVAHSDDGASVLVSVRVDDDSQIAVAIQDTGPGIAEPMVDRIFERFFRIDAARSRARGGTGIGLSIVKHVAQSHGGAIDVDSVEGSGSTFTLSFPVSGGDGRGTGVAR